MLDQIINFITEHWLLCGAFALVLIMIISGEMQILREGHFFIDANSLVKLINKNETTIIDIQPQSEYMAGHIINSINLVASNLSDNPEILKKYINKNISNIVIVCNNGQASLELVKKISKSNLNSEFKIKILALTQGLEGWLNADLPIVLSNKSEKTEKAEKKSQKKGKNKSD